MSNLLVQNIKHTNGTTSMVVDSSGHVATDTIKGNSTAGSISVVGEGNSTTTNLQQGLAKAWFNMDCTGTPSYRDSLNCSTLTDGGTGIMTHNFTNNMGNATYALSGAPGGTSGGWADSLAHYWQDEPDTTSSSKIGLTYNTSPSDNDRHTGSYHGDLA